MFDSLSKRFSSFFSGLRGKPILDEREIRESLKEIRLILLEADISLSVVKSFLEYVETIAIGDEKVKGVSTGQQLIKLVNDALVMVLSPKDDENSDLNLSNKAPNIILMTGLQGSGKTTSAGKLARMLSQKNKLSVLLASLDTIRPAAQEQLAVIANEINVDSLEIIKGQSAIDITKRAKKEAIRGHYDVLILDSAGRTSIDEVQMAELKKIDDIAKSHEKLLVIDAMTGQDAVSTAKFFNENINITGSILTRIDGDQRGGVAISLRAVTGVPIKFLGVGEKSDDFEKFDANRIADRIFDKGDIVKLVEEAKEKIDQNDSQKMAKKLAKGKFDLDDLAQQFKAMRKMGGIGKIASMLPGMGQIKSQIDDMGDSGEKKIVQSEAIISSMTKAERKNPKLLNASRKRRIAKGSGTEVMAINRLLKSYRQMSDMMKKMKNKRSMAQMFGGMQVDQEELANLENMDLGNMDGMDLSPDNLKDALATSNKNNQLDVNLGKKNFLPGLGSNMGAKGNSNLPGLDILLNNANKITKKK